MDTRYTPSTGWKEVVAPDEAQRFAGYARQFAELQARKSQKYGKGRGLHRKQLTAARGQLEVLGDLPAFAAQGLFVQPGSYEVRVRLSNGGMDTRYTPSTGWKEVVAPDEAQRFAGYARQFAELQARKSQKYGKGRGVCTASSSQLPGASWRCWAICPRLRPRGCLRSPGRTKCGCG